eukprot:27458-Pelagococcus_subviridis.AAC.4
MKAARTHANEARHSVLRTRVRFQNNLITRGATTDDRSYSRRRFGVIPFPMCSVRTSPCPPSTPSARGVRGVNLFRDGHQISRHRLRPPLRRSPRRRLRVRPVRPTVSPDHARGHPNLPPAAEEPVPVPRAIAANPDDADAADPAAALLRRRDQPGALKHVARLRDQLPRLVQRRASASASRRLQVRVVVRAVLRRHRRGAVVARASLRDPLLKLPGFAVGDYVLNHGQRTGRLDVLPRGFVELRRPHRPRVRVWAHPVRRRDVLALVLPLDHRAFHRARAFERGNRRRRGRRRFRRHLALASRVIIRDNTAAARALRVAAVAAAAVRRLFGVHFASGERRRRRRVVLRLDRLLRRQSLRRRRRALRGAVRIIRRGETLLEHLQILRDLDRPERHRVVRCAVDRVDGLRYRGFGLGREVRASLHARVRQDFVDPGPLRRLRDHQPLHQLLHVLRIHAGKRGELPAHHLVPQFLHAPRLERHRERAHLEEDAPQRPHVAVKRVRPRPPHLRGHVMRRPNLRVRHVVLHQFRHAEVAELDDLA